MSWNYPPLTGLLLSPLAEVTPRSAYFGMGLLNLGLAIGIGWRLGRAVGVAVALCFEPIAATIVLGQTSLVTTVLLWIGLSGLLRRPAISGATLGLLVIKPHLAWVVPLAVLGQGSWRIAVRAGAAGLGVAGAGIVASLIWPGPAAWTAFGDGLSQAGQALAARQFPWQQMPTLYVSLAALGAPAGIALAGQIAGAGLVGVLTYRIWRSRPGPGAVALSLIAATLASPYLYHYDLVCADWERRSTSRDGTGRRAGSRLRRSR